MDIVRPRTAPAAEGWWNGLSSTRDRTVSSPVTIVQGLDENPWREFVEQHPQGGIFHTPEMTEVFRRAKGHRPTVWAALDGSRHILALLLPVQVTLMDGALRRLTTRAISYGSVLCARSTEGKQALPALLDAYKRAARGSALFTELRNISDLTDLQPTLNAHGFAFQDHLDYIIDLNRSPEEVLQSIGPRTRKKIRQGLRKGDVVIEEATCLEQAEVCYGLLQRTYTAARVPLADWSLFKAAFEILYPRNMVKFLLARVGDQYAAGTVELVYKDTIYGWYGGMDRAYTDYIPNELLLWHLFEWGATHGYKTYDFGGAGSPDQEYGVRDFKSKFGGSLVSYGRNTCVHSPALFRMSQWGYAAYRRLKV